jgi:hypothetical protein
MRAACQSRDRARGEAAQPKRTVDLSAIPEQSGNQYDRRNISPDATSKFRTIVAEETTFSYSGSIGSGPGRPMDWYADCYTNGEVSRVAEPDFLCDRRERVGRVVGPRIDRRHASVTIGRDCLETP